MRVESEEASAVSPSGARTMRKKPSESMAQVNLNDGVPVEPHSVQNGSGDMPAAKETWRRTPSTTTAGSHSRQTPSRPSVKSSESMGNGHSNGRTTFLHQSDENVRSRNLNGEANAAHRNNGDNHDATGLERPRLFSGISPADFTGICSTARVKEFSRDEMLHFEGDAVERVLLLTAGFAKITKVGQGGAEVILRLAVPGDFLGAEGLIWCGKHCTTAQVLRPCRAHVWDARVFKGLIERFPVLHQNMVSILGEHLRELEDRFREVATGRVGARVALQILRLLKRIGRPVRAGVEITLSREELAQMTGTTLFTVSRLLSAWEARGVVRPRREAVAICNVELLQALAEEE